MTTLNDAEDSECYDQGFIEDKNINNNSAIPHACISALVFHSPPQILIHSRLKKILFPKSKQINDSIGRTFILHHPISQKE